MALSRLRVQGSFGAEGPRQSAVTKIEITRVEKTLGMLNLEWEGYKGLLLLTFPPMRKKRIAKLYIFERLGQNELSSINFIQSDAWKCEPAT